MIGKWSGYISDKAIIHPTAVIEGKVWIEEGVEIGAYTVVGTRGEYNNNRPKDGEVIIKSGTTIREHCTIQVSIDGNPTYIGKDCYIMNKCHIAHDVTIGDNCVVSTGSIIGGWCRLESNVNMGLANVVHQRTNIGKGAMLGMNSTITKHVPPYCTVVGSPARIMGLNKRGLERLGADERDINDLDYYFYLNIRSRDVETENPLAIDIHRFYNKYPSALEKFRNE
jgi:UDP-N-acetylglucosamine acyltransferase